MNETYTRLGDEGMTTTLCGHCVPKDSTICDICGEIDWLQAKLDRLVLMMSERNQPDYMYQLNYIHFKLGQISAEMSNAKLDEKIKFFVSSKDTDNLEAWITKMNIVVKGFQRFNKPLSIETNEIRVATRKFERTLTKYLREQQIRKDVYQYINRLSSYFFILSVKIQVTGDL